MGGIHSAVLLLEDVLDLAVAAEVGSDIFQTQTILLLVAPHHMTSILTPTSRVAFLTRRDTSLLPVSMFGDGTQAEIHADRGAENHIDHTRIA